MTEKAIKTIRLDKWLKLSRICKTRAIATKACEEGKVKVNDIRAKPARMVIVGDIITIKKASKYQKYTILDIVQKNISNKDARNLYREHEVEIAEESKELFELLKEWDSAGKRKFKGRPTKKERRDMDKLRGD
jgi:ribosome-associated heat shock protein Hsp15